MLGVFMSSLPMIVCGVLSVLIALSLYNHWNRAKMRLLLFMLTATVLYLAHYMYFNRQMAVIPLTDTFYSFCNPAVFPLYYLYIEELTEYRPNRWRQVLCLLPSLLCFFSTGLLYLLMDAGETATFVQHCLYDGEIASLFGLAWWQGLAHAAVRIVFALQIPPVLYYGFRRITAYNAVVESNYSNIEGKRIVGVKTLLVLFAVTSFFAFVFNVIGRQHFVEGPEPLTFPAVLFSLLLLLIGHVGLSQQFSVQDIEAEVFQNADSVPDEGGYSDSPKQTLRIVGLDPFLNKVETTIVIENLDDSHRGQQEHNDTGSTTHIIQENLIANVEFYSTTRRYLASQIVSIFARMLRHDEIGSPTDIEHPTHRTKKHGYSSLVNTSQMTCRYEQISEE